MKNLTKVFIFSLGLVLVIYLLIKILFTESEIVCGKFVRISSMKGNKTFIYEYFSNGSKYEGTVYPNDYKIKEFEEFQKIECVKIEVSTFIPRISKCIDKRILNE